MKAGSSHGTITGTSSRRNTAHGTEEAHRLRVVRVPLQKGKAGGEYEDFLTALPPRTARCGGVRWRGRGQDGSLFVSDDGSKSIWRVSYGGK